jgi:hypothetical protein
VIDYTPPAGRLVDLQHKNVRAVVPPKGWQSHEVIDRTTVG